MSTSERKPLRILMILRAPIGGLYRNVMDLTATLSARGHEIGIIADSRVEDAQTQRRLDELPSPPALGVYRFPIPRLLGWSDFGSMSQIRSLARSLDADVLHGHGAKGGLNARLSRIGNQKAISAYTPHGGVLNYEARSPLGRFLRLVERALIPHSDAIIFESEYAKREFESQIARVSDEVATVALNGLAEAEFERIDPALADHDFAFVGEFRSVKAVDLLLKALAPLKRPDGTSATAILAGKGPEEGHLRAIVDNLNLADRVTFAGVQPARSIFARGRCALMPSLAESLPYVALEAISAGRPMIATNVGGVNEIFGPRADRLVPAGDESALRAAMQAFLDDETTARRDAEACWQHVRAHFSLDRMTDTIEDAYYRALSRR